MCSNANLHKAKKAKNDEFYTQYEDIEAEVKYYKKHFKGKIVYCNCDDYDTSNFWKFFVDHFHEYKLKRLIATHIHLDGSPSEMAEYDGENIIITQLQGNGDFRSEECIEILKEADIVVTNPPFSLFREYMNIIIPSKIKCLILGNLNAVTYKDIFLYIQKKELNIGVNSTGMEFITPQNTLVSFGNICWFTNFDVSVYKKHINNSKTYKGNESYYPKYDNFNVINVNKIKDIPCDYEGVMGVPITILLKINKEQFSICGMANSARYIGYKCFTYISNKKIYNRVLIKRNDCYAI